MLLELVVAVLLILVFALLILFFWGYSRLRGRLNGALTWAGHTHGWINRTVGGPGDNTPPPTPPPGELL